MINDILSIGDICAFYDDEGEDYFVGFYLASDDEFSIFQLITPRGFDDGLYITLTESIFRVDVESRYVKKINKLFWLHKQELILYEHSGNDLMEFIFDYSMSNDYAVTVVLSDDEEVVGFVESQSENEVLVAIYDEFGEANGKTHISKAAVQKVGVNSVAMKNIKLLRDN